MPHIAWLGIWSAHGERTRRSFVQVQNHSGRSVISQLMFSSSRSIKPGIPLVDLTVINDVADGLWLSTRKCFLRPTPVMSLLRLIQAFLSRSQPLGLLEGLSTNCLRFEVEEDHCSDHRSDHLASIQDGWWGCCDCSFRSWVAKWFCGILCSSKAVGGGTRLPGSSYFLASLIV